MQLHWKPGIGDPTLVGWLTVGAYFAAFLFSVVCAKRSGSGNPAEKAAVQRRSWWFIAICLLLLGINKQLDLQTLFTEVGKVLAKQEGWYEQRRNFQELFIAGVACGGIFSLLIAWRAFRNVWKDNWLALVGMVFLVSFVVIRATSFHGVDKLLDFSLAGLKINWILELGGIACIGVSAAIYLNRIAKERRRITNRQNIFL